MLWESGAVLWLLGARSVALPCVIAPSDVFPGCGFEGKTIGSQTAFVAPREKYTDETKFTNKSFDISGGTADMIYIYIYMHFYSFPKQARVP